MRKYCLKSSLILWVTINSLLCKYGEVQTKSLVKCKEHEHHSLLNFKHSFSGDPMNRLSSWAGEDCCQWQGVTCDDITGNVIKLDLHSNPYDINDIDTSCNNKYRFSLASNALSSALLELKHLSHLDLSWNDFNGSPIPTFLGSMTNLRYLDISESGFSGLVPPQLGDLTNLVELNLSTYCNYHGLTVASLGWASGLLMLQSLDMGSCDVSSAQDILQVLSRLPSLLMLRLSDVGLENKHLFDITNGNSSDVLFPKIEHLDLCSNFLEGLFPTVLEHMSSLKFLSLSFNNLNGSIPIWVGNLKGIEVLDLRFNHLSGVEGGIWGIMGSPCNFKYLDLSGNKITGEILEPSENSSKCTNYDLEHLDLSGNEVNGSLPSLLTKLKNLKHLDLSSNRIQGQVPSNLTGLSSLTHLDLSRNLFDGLTPKHLGRLINIEHLGISSNSLQGTALGIANLSKLTYLDVDCKNLNLQHHFDREPRFQLQTLSIVGPCEMNAAFPPWLRTQNRIEKLDLTDCGFSGELPRWVGNMTNLELLFLANNHFTGSLTNFSTELGYLDLSNNFLTGAFPQNVISNDLHFLDLHNNILSGSIPHWLGHLKTLYYVDLSSNQLSGTITEKQNVSSLLTSSFLMILDLSDNELSGEIHFPKAHSQTNIISLNLRGNKLTGHIPSELCSLRSLEFMDLANNYFVGHIPPCLSLMFTNPSTGYTEYPGIDVTEIIKRQQQVFVGSSWLASNLDLSNNHLIGAIPEGITNISTLVGLNLSYNHLTGGIPRNIGNMKSLESLDLSNNYLSGTVPESLSVLTALSSLNLSNNDLHGLIPTGSQLQTFDDPSIYTGNSGLCGFPLTITCTEPNSTPNQTSSVAENNDKEDDVHDMYWFDLVIMMGIATGFWGVVGTLVVNESWREAYFRFVEEAANTIYVQFKVKVNRYTPAHN